MPDPEDIVEIGGVRVNKRADGEPRPQIAHSRFLSIWFRCCHTYGRLYRNRQQTAYAGRCPKCGAAVQARIGAGGTSRRAFEAS